MALPAKQQQEIVDSAFRHWRAHGFPHYRLTTAEVHQDYERVLSWSWKRAYVGGALKSSNGGLRLANAFQPNMWRARVSRYLSPMDVFQDDDLLRAAIERAFRIWPNRYSANSSSLRRILKSFPSAASVSNYNPGIAKAIVEQFSPPDGRVIDFCAGYGGRLLGCLAAGRTYVGIEPNASQIRGFERMRRAISDAGFDFPKSYFIRGPAEECFAEISSRTADLIFSSPPFFDWERYSRSRNQSYKRYPTYDLWDAGFLRPVLAEGYRVLRARGFLAINVTNGDRLPSVDHVRTAGTHAGFRLRHVYPRAFPKIPYLHPRNGKPIKHELVLVFQK